MEECRKVTSYSLRQLSAQKSHNMKAINFPRSFKGIIDINISDILQNFPQNSDMRD